MSKFQKKTSSFLVNVIIGLIVIAFVVSGMYTFNSGGAPDSVATVGEYPIRLGEFEREVKRQTDFYANFVNGGKPLTSAQIKQFNVRNNALNSLVNGKLMLTFADAIGAKASKEEIKNEIKNLEYFKTNGQFDINKYKQLLAYNRLTPEDFEADMANTVKQQKATPVAGFIPVSNNFVNQINELRSKGVNSKVVIINKEGLRKNLDVTKKEIKDYLAVEVNSKRVENLFNERKAALSQKEEVKASHILINASEKDALAKINKIAKKVNTKNFKKIAAKESQEPGADKREGSLGWFAKGRMVPEFEKVAFSMKPGTISKPVKTQFGYHIIFVEGKKAAKTAKFEDFKEVLTTELIQKEKNVAPLVESVSNKVKKAMASTKQLDKLSKRYAITVNKDVQVNEFDGATGIQDIKADQVKEILSGTQKLYTFDTVTSVILVKTSKLDAKMINKYDAAQAQRILSRVMQQNIIKEQKERVKVKRNSNISFR